MPDAVRKGMSIAVDQTRLRRITEAILGGEHLNRTQASTLLEIAQLAAGVENDDNPAEHSILQAVAQHIAGMVGLKTGEVLPIPPLPDEEARAHWLGSLASCLATPRVRELAYAVVFVVSVADLELTELERRALEQFQHALGLPHRRATDLVVCVSEIVAA